MFIFNGLHFPLILTRMRACGSQSIRFHPHIHAPVTEEVFLADGTFLPLPKLATEPFLKLWEQEVFALLLAEAKITEEVVADMRS